ncbi:hypothetical protein MRX96_041235 [Rhipicephalus microplus]
MEVVEEVLTSTATGGQHPKGSPLYGERLFPHTVSGRHTYQPQKEGKEEADEEATPGYCIGGHGCQPPPTFRSARRRARDLAAAVALPVDPAIVGTVLFRPSAPGGTFSGSPRLIFAQALSARPGGAAIRVNQKRNIVAADATRRKCLEQLLTIKDLKGIPVTAKEPADHKTRTGFLHGVGGEPVADSLLPGIQSAVPVLSAAREGQTVTLRLASPVPPEHVSLFLTPRSAPGSRRTGEAEGCQYHGIFPNYPLEACSGSGGARGDSGNADLCERGEGPPFAPPPLARPIPAPRESRRQPLEGQQSTGTAAPMDLPAATAVLRPRLLQLPLSRPSLLLLSLEAGLLCPRLLWPRLLRQ